MTPNSKSIEVNVLFFARAHELAGTNRDILELPAVATVAEASAALKKKFPKLSEFLDTCRIAVNQEFTDDSQQLDHGSEVAIIPPVSGG